MKRNYPYYEHQEINNLKELLEQNKKRNPHKIAFRYRSNKEIIEKTYHDVYQDVKHLSSYFYKKYKNKHIAVIGENSYNWIITFMSIILSGNLCVILDKDAEKEKIVNLLKQSDTEIIYYSNYYNSNILELPFKKYPLEDTLDYMKEGTKYKNEYKIDNKKEAVLFFTSGTTGPNKGVLLSQKNMASNIYGASSLFKLSGSVVSILPYHHAFGLITSVLKPFYYGKPIFINHSLKNVLKDLKEEKPETLFVVPAFVETFYKQIWKSARANKQEKILKNAIRISNGARKIGLDMRSKLFKSITAEFGGNLKYMICGGAYLDPKYIKWFRSIGIEILNGYGITECSPVVSVNRNEYHKDGSIGVPCRNTEVKIIDDEICIKGNNVMLGYYKDKKATESVIKDGYFHTGDLGYIDEDGFIFITGRIKNLIILTNGENISPEVLEAELMKDPGVCEVVVYSENNKIIVCIYPNEDYIGKEAYFNELIDKYNKDKPKNHQISLVQLRTTEFIKNSNKKIVRDKVKEGM